MGIVVKTVLTTLNYFYNYGIPSHILYFGESLGDNLLLTTIGKKLYDDGNRNIWIKCDYPDLFQNNPYVKLVIPFNTLLSTFLLLIFKVKVIRPAYTSYHPLTDSDTNPDKHIILKMADCLQLKGEIINKPIFNLTAYEEKKGQISLNQIVIITSATAAKNPMMNKEWIPERFQQLVDVYADKYTFIHLGAVNDYPLTTVVDLRGKTNIKESAAILKNSLLMISHVGFMMHLARAVDCPAVIIYGGREKPWQSGYNCFQNIYSDLQCSPCWLHNKCDYGRKCMTSISTQIVAEAIENQLNTNKHLSVDVLFN